MSLRCIIFGFIIFYLPTQSLADEAFRLNDLKGVYKQQHENGDVSGSRYVSVDELTILPLTKNTAYFHTQLWFFNGHQCELSGIADAKDDALTYSRFKNEDGNYCTFRIRVSDKTLSFEDDDGACRSDTCGTRGGYGSTVFSRKQRTNNIDKYKILHSDEYKVAFAEHQAILGHNELPAEQQTHEWYRQASDLAYLKSLSPTDPSYNPAEVGRHYLHGEGVAKNTDEARKWFLKAAALNDAEAQYRLGLMYEVGLGVKQDYAEAMKWYLIAAKGNHGLAQGALGRILYLGLAGKPDDQEAYFWLTVSDSKADLSDNTPLPNITAEQRAKLNARVLAWRARTSKHRAR